MSRRQRSPNAIEKSFRSSSRDHLRIWGRNWKSTWPPPALAGPTSSKRGKSFSRTGLRFLCPRIACLPNCFSRTSGSVWKSCAFASSIVRRIGNPHSDGRHSPDHFGFGFIIELANTAWRERMRDQSQLVAVQLAPRARIAVSQFDEINGPIVLTPPWKCLNLVHALINLKKRAGSQQGIHCEIVQTDV